MVFLDSVIAAEAGAWRARKGRKLGWAGLDWAMSRLVSFASVGCADVTSWGVIGDGDGDILRCTVLCSRYWGWKWYEASRAGGRLGMVMMVMMMMSWLYPWLQTGC